MLSPRWRKVLSDLLGNKTRTVLVVLSIAIGIFAIGMIGGTQEMFARDLPNAYMAVNPASATLYTDSFDDDLVQMAKNVRGVGEASGRRSMSVRVEVAPGQTKMLNLQAVPDFRDIRINKMSPVSGAWPPGDREIILERASAEFLGLQIGDTAVAQLSDGKERPLRVVGTAHDVNQPPPMFYGQGIGYATLDTIEWLGAPRSYNELNIIPAEGVMDKQHVEEVAAAVREKVEGSGRTVYFTYVPEPGKHPADSMMQAVLLLLGVLGVLALGLSGFLVVNTISALLAQQGRFIGVMKAVGARSGQITVMYLVTVMGFGVMALIIGIPLGALGAYGMGGFMAGIMNFDVTNYTPPVHVLLVEVVVGVGVPVLAALWPILSGTRVTAREAMSAHGTGKGAYGRGLVDRLLENVRGLSRPMLLSLRNTFRRKGRLALTLVTLTLGGSIFIAVFSVRESTMATLDDALGYFKYDVSVNFRKLYREDFVVAEALNVPGVAAAESPAGASARRMRDNGTEGNNMSVLALAHDTTMIKPILLEGRWLLAEDENAIVVNTIVTQDEPDVKVGGEVTFKIDGRETTWKVVGIVRGVMTGPIAYANKPYFEREMRSVGRAGNLWVALDRNDAVSRKATTEALTEYFKERGINVGSTEAMADTRDMIQGQFDLLIIFLMVMAILMAAVGGLGLMGTMSLNVIERTREIGVMRAIGASDGAVRQVFVVEGVLIGFISWLVGTLIAMPISQGLSYSVGLSLLQAPLSYRFSLLGAGIWLVAVIVLALLASILPAWNASRLSVREVLAYE